MSSDHTQSGRRANAKKEETGEEADRIREGSTFQSRIVAGKKVAGRRNFLYFAEPVNQDYGRSTLFGLIQILARFVAGQVHPVLQQAAEIKKLLSPVHWRQARVGHLLAFSTPTFDNARRFAWRIDLTTDSCILSRTSASRWRHEF